MIAFRITYVAPQIAPMTPPVLAKIRTLRVATSQGLDEITKPILKPAAARGRAEPTITPDARMASCFGRSFIFCVYLARWAWGHCSRDGAGNLVT